MHNLTNATYNNIAELRSVIASISQELDDLPFGALQIDKTTSGNYSYKQVICENYSKSRVQLQKNDTPTLSGLSKKSYYQKLLPALRQELAALEKFQKSYDFMKKYEVYRNLHPEKKKFVRPLFPTVETKVEDWKNKPERSLDWARGNGARGNRAGDWTGARGNGARGNRAGDKWARAAGDWAEPMFNTDFGMRLRSKSEYMIAMELHRRQTEGQLLFRYEQELRLADGGVVYPDFEIISLRTGNIYYYEHFGMMDDADYFDAFVRKMQRYARGGVLLGQSLIATYETSKKPLHLSQIKTALEIIS